MLASTFRDAGTPSVAADRVMIARAEGGQMPAVAERPTLVARLDPPRRSAPAGPERPEMAAVILPPVPGPTKPQSGASIASVAPAPRPAAVSASLAPLPPSRPAKAESPTIPAEILAAVRPSASVRPVQA
ncbi:hypothetical protein J8J40_22325, partial [Mycobacterium tuberculosis]|nr:hypothetical protein [Mycobacterium tuberculosis]